MRTCLLNPPRELPGAALHKLCISASTSAGQQHAATGAPSASYTLALQSALCLFPAFLLYTPRPILVGKCERYLMVAAKKCVYFQGNEPRFELLWARVWSMKHSVLGVDGRSICGLHQAHARPSTDGHVVCIRIVITAHRLRTLHTCTLRLTR